MKIVAALLALLVISGCVNLAEQNTSANSTAAVQPLNNATLPKNPDAASPKTDAITPILKLVQTFKTNDSVYGAAVAENGHVVLASWDGYVYALHKSDALLWKRELKGSPQDAAMSADGSYVAATGYLYPQGTLYFFNRSELLWQIIIQDYVKGVDVARDGSFVALGSGDGKVRLYHHNGSLAWDFQTDKGAWGVWDVSISPDSKYLAAASDDTYVYLLDMNGKLLWKRSQGKNSYLYGAAVSRNAERVAAASQDGSVYVYDKNGTLVWKHKTSATNYGVALSSNGEYLAIASWDKNLYLLDEKGALIQKYALDSEANRVAFSQDDRFLALGTKLGYAYLFEIGR